MSSRVWLQFGGAAVIYLVSVGLFLYAGIQWGKADEFAPLRNINPQPVLTATVAEGTFVRIEGTKCNNTDGDLGVEGRSFWRNLDANTLTVYTEGTGVRPPGCETRVFTNSIVGLPPGRYRLEGVDIVRSGNNVQQEAWYSEEFVIKAAP